MEAERRTIAIKPETVARLHEFAAQLGREMIDTGTRTDDGWRVVHVHAHIFEDLVRVVGELGEDATFDDALGWLLDHAAGRRAH